MVRLIKERTPDWGEKKANAILIFLNNYVSFQNPETNRIFMEQTDVIMGKKNTMGILEQLAEIKAAEALEEGKELGKALGRLEGKEETIRIMLKATDFPPEKIAGLVDVPVSLVKKIQNA